MNKHEIKIPRLLIKTILLLLIFNFAFPIFSSISWDNLSLYNRIFPGRERLPFGETPELAYNTTLNDLDAMLASHIVAGEMNEAIDIFVIGDSSVWGTLLKNEDTITHRLQEKINSPDNFNNRKINIYNLGYPTTSVLKDLVILDKAMSYEPDVVIWFVTLNSLVKDAHLDAPIVMNNPEVFNQVVFKYDLPMDELPETSYIQKTFLNQRRNIYDRIHLQLLGAMWTATGIDQYIPEEYTRAARDLEADDTYQSVPRDGLTSDYLDLAIIESFVAHNPKVEVLVVNEPILISDGANSDIRYNYYYPRWAYDQYRAVLADRFLENGIKYIDLWDIIPEPLFTNSAIHYNNEGVAILVDALLPYIEKEVLD